jgi:hypothetical protein
MGDCEKKFVLYLYNNSHDYKRVNTLYQTESECIKDLDDLNTKGTWLNIVYGGIYKHAIIFDINKQDKPIKKLISEALRKEN